MFYIKSKRTLKEKECEGVDCIRLAQQWKDQDKVYLNFSGYNCVNLAIFIHERIIIIKTWSYVTIKLHQYSARFVDKQRQTVNS
jgi:hypothetical protein